MSLGVRSLAGFGLAVAAAALLGSTVSVASLATVLAIYAFADALPVLFLSSLLPSRALLVAGAADLALGALLLFSIPASVYGLSALAGIWAMGTGMLVLLGAGAFARRTTGRFLFGSGGAVSVGVGIGLGIFPNASARVLATLLGALGLVVGGLSLALAVRGRTDAAASCAAGPGPVIPSSEWTEKVGRRADAKERP